MIPLVDDMIDKAMDDMEPGGWIREHDDGGLHNVGRRGQDIITQVSSDIINVGK